MSTRLIHGISVFVLDPDDRKVQTDRDATEIVGEARECSVELVATPVERLDNNFFQLKTRVAGEILQKFVLCKLRVAIVGDISWHLEASSALRDFVYESNRGSQIWFASSFQELEHFSCRCRGKHEGWRVFSVKSGTREADP